MEVNIAKLPSILTNGPEAPLAETMFAATVMLIKALDTNAMS